MGQVANLRGGWLPPPLRCERGGTLWVGPIDNRPQLTKLPHNSAPSLAHADAQIQAVLLINRVGVHFCVVRL